MNIAIYGKQFSPDFDSAIKALLEMLLVRKHNVTIFDPFTDFLRGRNLLSDPDQFTSFQTYKGVQDCDVCISIGGDGTLLATAGLIRDSNVPVLGINTGRLGFLSNVSTEDIEEAIISLEKGDFKIDERALIKVEVAGVDIGDFPYALNEVTIHKKDRSSMVKVHAYMEDLFINTYWADGLIVATPTGSTAYSLSCGGPIVMPGSENLILTPIAPHNLNVRPLVVPCTRTIRLFADGRGEDYLLTLDSRSYTISAKEQVKLSSASFKLKLLNLPSQHFFQTIRNKMLWGIDKRN
ncbi:MAG: NAD+ kinase [Flavobacteriales bacterium]|jgi:NAD+ kinase